MSNRTILESSRIQAAALAKMNALYPETIREVEQAVRDNAVVVIGMAQNPHVKSVRKALEEANVPYKYLEYGSYFSGWRRRLSIKMWSGWPTFPQVFVRGMLFGGTDLTKAALADGTLRAQLEASTNGESKPATV